MIVAQFFRNLVKIDGKEINYSNNMAYLFVS